MLPKIEAAAGQMFRDVGMHAVADDDPPTTEELAEFLAAEGILVAVDDHDRPVAYLLVMPLDGWAHVEQVSVWAEQGDLAGLTLTTFEHVPWNAPYYRRLGFHTIEVADLSVGLRETREREAAGPRTGPVARVAMLRSRSDRPPQ
jgi:hypothetical protein